MNDKKIENQEMSQESASTMLASEQVLKKDWLNKEDECWNSVP